MSQFLSNSQYARLFPPSARLAPFGSTRQARPEQLYPPPTQEEEDEITAKLLSGSMGLLQYGAETIDKFGRATRGLLAGRPGELLNLIPFSDMLGITDPQKGTSGRDIVENLGFAPNDPDKWFEPGDIAGFAAEVLLDPLTYVAGPAVALSKSAQALKRAGLLEDIVKVASKKAGRKVGPREAQLMTKVSDFTDPITKIADPIKQKATIKALDDASRALGIGMNKAANEGIGGLLGIGLPFSSPKTVIGTGAGAKRVAQGMDWLGGAAMRVPGVSGTRSLFDRAMKGIVYEPAQRVLAPLSKLLKKSRIEADEQIFDIIRSNPDFKKEELVDSMRQYWESPRVEGRVDTSVDENGIEKWRHVLGGKEKDKPLILEDISQTSKDTIDALRLSDDVLLQDLMSNGLNIKRFKDLSGIEFSHRGALLAEKETGKPVTTYEEFMSGFKAFETTSGMSQKRINAIRAVPVATLHRLMKDVRFQGANSEDATEIIVREYIVGRQGAIKEYDKRRAAAVGISDPEALQGTMPNSSLKPLPNEQLKWISQNNTDATTRNRAKKMLKNRGPETAKTQKIPPAAQKNLDYADAENAAEAADDSFDFGGSATADKFPDDIIEPTGDKGVFTADEILEAHETSEILSKSGETQWENAVKAYQKENPQIDYYALRHAVNTASEIEKDIIKKHNDELESMLNDALNDDIMKLIHSEEGMAQDYVWASNKISENKLGFSIENIWKEFANLADDPFFPSGGYGPGIIGEDPDEFYEILKGLQGRLRKTDKRVSHGKWVETFHIKKPADIRKNPEFIDRVVNEKLGDWRSGTSGKHKELNKLYGDAKELADWIRTRDKEYFERGVGIFGKHVLEDHRKYRAKMEILKHSSDAIHELFANEAKTASAVSDKVDEWISIKDALKAVGFTGKAAIKGEPLPAHLRQIEMIKGVHGGDVPIPDLEGLYVPKKAADAAMEMMRPGKEESVNWILGAIDSYTNLWKMGVTAAPAFHARNRNSGIISNAMHGALTLKNWAKSMRMAHQVVNGKGAAKGLANMVPAYKGMTDEAATKILREEILINRVWQSQLSEITGKVEPDSLLKPQDAIQPGLGGTISPTSFDRAGVKGMMADFPQNEALSAKTITGKAYKQARTGGLEAWLPWNFAGFGKQAEDKFFVAGLHRDIGNYVEGHNRIEAFIGLRQQGYSAIEAGKKANLIHIDYSNLSTVERKFFRRVFPFYTFTRGKTAHVAKALMEHPGGKLAQTLRATSLPRKEEGSFVPKYVGEGAAIKIGPERYVSRFGFMHEAPFELGAIGPNIGKTFGRTLQKFGTSLNPLAKTPIELMTGQNLFTGRPQKETYPYPLKKGFPQHRFLNTLISGSPFSRHFSTARRLTDVRKPLWVKALSTGLGVGIVDVPPKARDFAAREAVREALRDSDFGKEVIEPFFPKEAYAELSNSDKDLMRLYRAQKKRAREAVLNKSK